MDKEFKPDEIPEGADILSDCCGVFFNSDYRSICRGCKDHTGFSVYDRNGERLGSIDPSEW